jgi:hypothetical protein
VAQANAIEAKLQQTHNCALIPSFLALAHRSNAEVDRMVANHPGCHVVRTWNESAAIARLQRECRSGQVASNTAKSQAPETSPAAISRPETKKSLREPTQPQPPKIPPQQTAKVAPEKSLAAISRPEETKKGLSKGSYQPQDTAAFGEWNTGNASPNNSSSNSSHWDWNTPRATGAPVHPWGGNDQNRVANMPAQYPQYLLPSGVGQSIYNQSGQPSYWTPPSDAIAALIPYLLNGSAESDETGIPSPILDYSGTAGASAVPNELKYDPEFLGPQGWHWVGPPQDTLHGPTPDWKPGDPCDIELPECTAEFADTPSAEDWNKGPEGIDKGINPPPRARGVIPEWFEVR